MKYLYANKKFTAAVTGMATSPKNIQERVRIKFSNMFQRLTTCEPIGDKGSIQATIDQMSTDEATEIAMDIVYMADIVHSKLSDL